MAAYPEYIIHISVDGLRPDAINNHGSVATHSASDIPNFLKLRKEGAFTDNARTDSQKTNTLPNHTSQITGRPVFDESSFGGTTGHHVIFNDDNSVDHTDLGENLWQMHKHDLHDSSPHDMAAAEIAQHTDFYIPSVLDAVHDNGIATGVYVGKPKFKTWDRSYDGDTGALEGGAPDVTGADNGRDKTVFEFNDTNSGALTTSMLNNLATRKYSFIHYADTDDAGHASGWMSDAYMDKVDAVDGFLGTILATVDNPTSIFYQKTTIILTTDHGGTGSGHGTPTEALNFEIPFYAWGAGVYGGDPTLEDADLYLLNPDINGNLRTSPLDNVQPAYGLAGQPIRNGDVANLVLDLLRLPPVAGSNINVNQDLTLGTTHTVPGLTAGDDTVTIAISGTNLAVTVNGSPQASVPAATISRILVNGGAGNDNILVDASVNIEAVLRGEAGDDTLTGGSGNDSLVGGTGSDVLTGGAGWDTADYWENNSAQGITIDIDGVADDTDGLGGTDNVKTDIEIVVGGAGTDSITGSTSPNYLRGNEGNDVLVGLGGNDTLQGGAGTDTASYSAAPAAVAISLDNVGTDDDGYGGKDNVLTDVEHVTGSGFNDSLIGSTLANSLSGGGGDDTFVGHMGNDTMVGGTGSDTADYSANTATQAINVNLGVTGGDAASRTPLPGV